jgi:hypothetical protein
VPDYPYSELSLSAQTAYAQVLEVALSFSHHRSVANLPGDFTCKTIKGKKYWYYQFMKEDGKRVQVFVGPDNSAVQALIHKKKTTASDVSVEPLVRSAQALGCASLPVKQIKVLKRLEDYGFFHAGGILIGTHAFIAYGNMLGMRWGATTATHTQDIDFAHAGKNMSLALNQHFKISVAEAIESLEMGFLPNVSLSGKHDGTYFAQADPGFRLDFLTTIGRNDEPFLHPQLNLTLCPLKFMEFSLEDVQQAVLFSGRTAVVVNIPHPARYALHKLIILGERKGAFQVKSKKDLIQSGLLLTILKDQRPYEVEEAWKNLMNRGPGWVSRAKQGLDTLDHLYPALELKKWLNNERQKVK